MHVYTYFVLMFKPAMLSEKRKIVIDFVESCSTVKIMFKHKTCQMYAFKSRDWYMKRLSIGTWSESFHSIPREVSDSLHVHESISDRIFTKA